MAVLATLIVQSHITGVVHAPFIGAAQLPLGHVPLGYPGSSTIASDGRIMLVVSLADVKE